LIKDAELDDPLLRDNLLARFARYGVAGDRLGLLGKTSRPDHLEAMNKVDIALDPFPQNGRCQHVGSLADGVPVVASLGDALSSRAAAASSGRRHAGLGSRQRRELHRDRGGARIGGRPARPFAARVAGRIAASPAGNPAVYAGEVGKGLSQHVGRSIAQAGRIGTQGSRQD